MDSNLYHATLPSDRKKTKRCGWSKLLREKEEEKRDRGHKNVLVSNSYATNVLKWLMGRFSVLKDILHLPPAFRFSLAKSLSSRISGLFITESCLGFWIAFFKPPGLNFQFCTDPSRSWLPTSVSYTWTIITDLERIRSRHYLSDVEHKSFYMYSGSSLLPFGFSQEWHLSRGYRRQDAWHLWTLWILRTVTCSTPTWAQSDTMHSLY